MGRARASRCLRVSPACGRLCHRRRLRRSWPWIHRGGSGVVGGSLVVGVGQRGPPTRRITVASWGKILTTRHGVRRLCEALAGCWTRSCASSSRGNAVNARKSASASSHQRTDHGLASGELVVDLSHSATGQAICSGARCATGALVNFREADAGSTTGRDRRTGAGITTLVQPYRHECAGDGRGSRRHRWMAAEGRRVEWRIAARASRSGIRRHQLVLHRPLEPVTCTSGRLAPVATYWSCGSRSG